MKQRRHYSSGRQYRKARPNNDSRQRSNLSYTAEGSDQDITLRAFDLEAFPPATLLQEYEYATDGAANRLIDMAIEEQQRRFAREDADDRFNKKTIRISQFFGFVCFLVILIETLILFRSDKEYLGLVLFFGSLAAGFIASLSVAFCNRGRILKNSEGQATKSPAPAMEVVATAAKANAVQPQVQERRHNNGNGSHHSGGSHRGNGNNHRRRDDRLRGGRRRSSSGQPR